MRVFLAVLLLTLSACSQTVFWRSATEEKDSEGELALLEKSQREQTRVEPSVPYVEPKIVLRDTPEVRKFLYLYTSRHRSFITHTMAQREKYLPMIERVFRAHEMPIELSNVAFIESRFNPNARSPQGATGMWQFMKSTGRRFGLSITLLKDERKDPLKSTMAAAKYLQHLHEQFDDWFLAVGAYNGGPGRVSRAIKKYGTRDFFELARKGGVKKETADFVAKFIALSMITRNLDVYGFEDQRRDYAATQGPEYIRYR